MTITRDDVSLEATLDRIAQLHALLRPPAPVAPPPPSAPAAPTAFSRALASASAAGAPAAAASVLVPAGTPAGAAALAAAQGEVGVAEAPPGSNDGPRIAQYRSAVAGNPGPGPWCAYFVSWCARQAGAPLGEVGQGFGRVDDVMAWAQRTGRVSATPQPGDLVVWDEHIGIVEAVAPDGSVTTIEGNSSDAVTRRRYGGDAGGALGFVRLG